MSLSFLTPWLLAGAALIAVPIIIHLIMRKKPKHLLFPAFRFLKLKHRTTVQKLRLRHFLLLAMRILLILLICGALARPELTGGDGTITPDAALGVILVFDTSASMDYEHNGKSRLEEAKEMAAKFLEGLPANSKSKSKVVIIDTAEPGAKSVDVADALVQIKNRNIRPYNRPVTDSLREILQFLTREKLDKENNPERSSITDLPLLLCVFSDRTAASWNADAVQSELLSAKKRVEEHLGLEAPLSCVYVDLSAKEPGNAAITGLRLLQGDSTAATALEDLKLGLARKPQTDPADGVEVRLQATVQVTNMHLQQNLVLSHGGMEQTQRVSIQAPLGQTRTQVVTFTLKLKQPVNQGEVRLEKNDVLKADDARYWTLPVSQYSVLIIADEERDAKVWRIALESLGGEGLLPAASTVVTPERALEHALEHLDPNKHQVVCMINVADPSPLWDHLGKYVKEGGGLIVQPGAESVAKKYQTEPALRILPGRLEAKVKLETGGYLVTTLSRDSHKIVEQFQIWDRPVHRVPVYQYWDVQLQHAGKELGKTIIPYSFKQSSGQSQPALIEREFNRNEVRGRVLLLTSPVYAPRDEGDKWNGFVPSWLVVALPYATTRYLLDAVEEPQNFELRDVVRLRLPSGPGFRNYTVSGPAGGIGAVEAGQRELSVHEARVPGNYTVSDSDNDGKSWQRRFSLNLWPLETQLTEGRPSVEDLESLLGEKSVAPLDNLPELSKVARDRLGQAPKSDLLPYVMIGVLLFLAVENLLANRFYRREPEEP